MADIRELLGLLASVPIHHIDLNDAQARGDHAAIRYSRAVREWQAQASRILDEVETVPARRVDAFRRVAMVGELTRSPA